MRFEFFFLGALFFCIELLYFYVADKFNIIDKPNQRSSHTIVTLRGGGVIFYVSALFYFLLSNFNYKWFFLGLTLMAVVSFLDDVFTLSNKIRIFVHFLSVILMAYELDVFQMPWFYLIITFIFVVGVINAYNFMDGINGITAFYSLVVVSLLTMVNNMHEFVDQKLLNYTILSLIVFAFFNFRPKAKCFAGDIGSVVIAYILLFALGALIFSTGNAIYILFLTVYGVDAIWTIIYRVYRKENIFEAHRSHLYQFLGNEAGVNKLLISFTYGVIQFGIGLLVIRFSREDAQTQLVFSFLLLSVLSCIYLVIKSYIIKKYLI